MQGNKVAKTQGGLLNVEEYKKITLVSSENN